MKKSESLLPLPRGPFDLVLADPPWKFASNSAARPGRNAARHYNCLSLADIRDMPVRELCARDAVLLLWVTSPFLRLAFDVVEAWGFKYKSDLIWDKGSIGNGFWARNQHEPLFFCASEDPDQAHEHGLLCARGHPPVRPRDSEGQTAPAPFPCSVIRSPKRQHSRKPDSVHDLIDAAPQWQGFRKLELFARQERPGWTVWGDETSKFNAPGQIPADLEDLI